MRRKKKFGLIAACLVGGLALLLVGGWFYVNTGAFIRWHVVPYLSKMLGEPIAVREADFAVLNRLELRQVTIGPAGDELLKAETIRVRYDGWAIVRGKLEVAEVTVDGLTVDATRQRIEDILARLPKAEPKEKPTPTRVQQVKLTSIVLRYREMGLQVQVEIPEATVPELASDGVLKASATANVTVRRFGTIVRVAKGTLTADGDLGPDLIPTRLTVQGDFPLEGEVGPLKLDGRTLAVALETTGDAIAMELGKAELLALNQGQPEGRVTLHGRIGLKPVAAAIDIAAEVSDPAVLDLVGGLVGDYRFGKTTASYEAKLTVDGDGETASLDGTLAINQLTIASAELGLAPLAPLTVRSRHEVAVSSRTQQAEVRQLELTVNDATRELARVWLDRPLHLGTMGTVADGGAATLRLTTDRLPLALFRPLAPPDLPVDLDGAELSTDLTFAKPTDALALNAEGTVTLTGLRSPLAPGIPALQVGVEVAADAKLDGWRVLAEVLRLTIRVQDPQQEVLLATLPRPFPLTFAPLNGGLVLGDGAVVAKIAGLSLVPYLSLVPEGLPVSLNNGRVTLEATVQSLRAGESIQLDGTAEVTGIDVAAAGVNLSGLSMRKVFALTLDDFNQVAPMKATVTVSRQTADGESLPLVTVNSVGQATLAPLSGQATVTVSDVTPAALALAEPWLNGASLGTPRIGVTTIVSVSPEEIEADAALRIEQLAPSLPGMALEKTLAPLTIDLRLAAGYGVKTEQIQLSAFHTIVTEPDRELARVQLNAPATLPLSALTPTLDGSRLVLPPLALSATVDGFDLARLLPLLPAATGVRSLAGALQVNLATMPDLVALNGATCELRVNGLQLRQEALGELRQPLDILVSLPVRRQPDGLWRLAPGNLAVSREGAEVVGFDLEATVSPDLATTRSEVRLTARGPLDVDKLQALLIPPTETAAPSGGGGGAGESGAMLPDNVWLLAVVKLPEVTWRQLAAKAIVIQAELKEGKLTVADSGLNLNGAPVSLQASVDGRSAVPAYVGKVGIQGLPLAPFKESFAAALPIGLAGGLKVVEIDFAGQGLDVASLRDRLQAQAKVDLDEIRLTEATGLTATALQLLAMKNFDLQMSDFAFDGGSGTFAYTQGLVQIPACRVTNQQMRYSFDGRLSVKAPYVPAMTVVPAFRGDKAKALLAKGLKLTDGGEGWFVAPPLPLGSSLWSPAELTKAGVKYASALGMIDGRAGIAAEALDNPAALLKLLDRPPEKEGTKETAPADPKKDAQKALEDAAKGALRDLFK